ncbi:DUF805 domain-containing protein [Mammaliicoccus vitulinus]|uniref:DUF805 domain-containing protein n=1 Tax=Mammaliicoccus vitulinus TaxID=71237 RepID=A0A2T4PQM4_9STAP|nr:DUF805 domain-containing protein [Mammaliicoccus vitulinus]PTI28131.1 DUF805 domain-containing protein [Mammaliicoccus vitulinus]
MNLSQNQIIRSYKDFWTRFSDVKGRSTRPELWHPFWINCIIFSFLGIISLGILSAIFTLVIIMPSFAVTARRLHDSNHTMSLAVFSHIASIILTIAYIVFFVDIAAETISSGNSTFFMILTLINFFIFFGTASILALVAPFILYFLVISGNEQPNDYGSEGSCELDDFDYTY